MPSERNFLIETAEEHLHLYPNDHILRLTYQEQIYWIKRRPFSKKTMWHRLQQMLPLILPFPIFYPTVTAGGEKSLADEAARLQVFAMKGIAVPQIMAITPTYLLLCDVGQPLHQLIQKMSYDEKYKLLSAAVMGLSELHRAGLCHGRPSLRDMTWLNNRIHFIDLEENPLLVMTLAQAQARDIWLFFNSVARFIKHDLSLLPKLFQIYQPHMNSDTLSALKQMVRLLKPARFFFENFMGFIGGKDVRSAILANKTLEQAMLKNS